MGNFEKLVVLTVLFLSAIVLAVSLSSDDESGAGLTPFDDAAQQARGGADGAAAGNAGLAMTAEGERRDPPAKARTASAPKRSEGASQPEEPATLPAQPTNAEGHPRVLRTRLGLSPSPLEDYMVYTPGANDTWSMLAERFYRSATYVPLLRAANEGLERPHAGEAILVPVYDFRAAPKDHEPRQAAPARAVRDEPVRTAGAAQAAAGATTYVVVDGDNLWNIASKVYGSGARWMEIYEANRDVMSDPDSLTIGMTLRVPR